MDLGQSVEDIAVEKSKARARRIAKLLEKILKITEEIICKIIAEIVSLDYPKIEIERRSYFVRKGGRHHEKDVNVLFFLPKEDKHQRSEPFVEQVNTNDPNAMITFLLDLDAIADVITEKKAKAKPAA